MRAAVIFVAAAVALGGCASAESTIKTVETVYIIPPRVQCPPPPPVPLVVQSQSQFAEYALELWRVAAECRTSKLRQDQYLNEAEKKAAAARGTAEPK